jgi:hypothetical protein
VQSLRATPLTGTVLSTASASPSSTAVSDSLDDSSVGPDKEDDDGDHSLHWGLFSALFALIPLCCLGGLLLVRYRYRRRVTHKDWQSTELSGSKSQVWSDIPNAVCTQNSFLDLIRILS